VLHVEHRPGVMRKRRHRPHKHDGRRHNRVHRIG
jgi:hypothetical protein